MDKLPSPSDLASIIPIVLKDLGGRAHFKDLEKAVAKTLNLSSEATSLLRSGKRTEFAYRLSWARTKCQSDGLIKKEGSGFWKLS